MAQSADFPHTRWSLIRAVQSGAPDQAAAAMEDICRSYWYPIYAFVRRSGHSQEDAEDCTQEFFARLVEDETLKDVRPEAAKLRSFLLGVLKRLLSDKTRHQNAKKRGGGVPHLSFDEMQAEERYQAEPRDTSDPEMLYHRAWAQNLLQQVGMELRESFKETSREDTFEQLAPFLMLEADPPSYADAAAKLEASEAAVRLMVFRMRAKFRERIKDAVAATVPTELEAESELRWLRQLLSPLS